MKRLTNIAAPGVVLVGMVAGLAFLAWVLAGPWASGVGADPVVTVGVDVNVSGNTPTSLGTRQGCVTKPGPVAESGAACANNTDDDGDTKVNDGCPASGAAETGAQCYDATDSDGDTLINDGCPATGVPFDVDVTLKDVPSLQGFDVTLSYTPTILNVTGYDVLQMLNAASGSNVLNLSDPGMPDTDGYWRAGAFDIGTGHESGSGVLVRVTLQAVGTGVSDIDMSMVSLIDATPEPIPPLDSLGYFAGPAFNGQIAVGVPCPDTDNDGKTDAEDNCPVTYNPTQTDSDGDYRGDACDNCASTPNWDQLNTDGDAMGDACDPDDDNDTIPDTSDNCRTVANPDQKNTDGDAMGDACDPDDDNDTTADTSDNCPLLANPGQEDGDSDNVGDACDNCPSVSNPTQANHDSDTHGDACDPDDDNDGFADTTEAHYGSDPLNASKTPELCDGLDNDGDTTIDEGYDISPANGVPDCTDPAADTDGDTRPESGAECTNNVDNDGDTKINDGCPAVGAAETGTQCDNATDDDTDGSVNDGCPTAGYTNPTDPNDDNDGADWTDANELKIGTDTLDKCSDDTQDPAWPPDIKNDHTVDVLDVVKFIPVLGSRLGGTGPNDYKFDRRYDLKPDLEINILDVVKMRPYLGLTCT
jgi:hypothetical protein